MLVVLQGIDAAGKDSTVKHVFSGSNPQGVRVYSFKEPTAEEAAHDFLWRYHQDAPARGMIHVFNRSHYEDVLVVRVKELVEEERWRSRYDSINDFERMLARERIVIVKFFLHISKDAQLERFRERLEREDKHYKFSANDVRERRNWDAYQEAYGDAVTPDLDAVGAVVRGPGGRQVVPQPGGGADRRARRCEAMDPRWPEPDAELEDYALEELEESTSSKR